jgi:hypothetical protein
VRRTLPFLLFLLVAASAAAQTIRVGPEHAIPRALGQSTIGPLIALLPHGDSVVAFWAGGGPLNATLLDRQGNVLSETVIPEIDESDQVRMAVAQAGNGYLVVRSTPPGTSHDVVATPLDFDLHVRRSSVKIDAGSVPRSLACGATRCAVVLDHLIGYDTDSASLMFLGLDGSVAGRSALPTVYGNRVIATAHGFLTTYADVHGGLHSTFFDDSGVARHTSDFTTTPLLGTRGNATAVGDGAIVVWSKDNELRASRLDPAGVVVETRTIATFTFRDFEGVAVACSGTECTAGVEWYYDSYFIIGGSWFPLAEIHAVRFTTALEPADPKPVRIVTPPWNEYLKVVATPAGTILGWTAFRGNVARVAFLGRGTVPYTGDVNVPGRPINSGPVWVGKIAAIRGALAWTDFAADEQRSIRFTHIDDDGVPVEATPVILAQDHFADPESPKETIELGAVGDSHVVAWQSDWQTATYARVGDPPVSIRGRVEAMFTDGTESVLGLTLDKIGLLRFSGGPPARSSTSLQWLTGGGLSHGKLFLQSLFETLFIDLDRSNRVSTPAVGQIGPASFAFGERSVLAFTFGRDDKGVAQTRLQRFTLDGRPIDPRPLVIGGWNDALFAVPLGSRFLIVWDAGQWGSGPVYAAVFDPESGTLGTPSVVSSGTSGRHLAGLIPRDATHAIVVFRTATVVTQVLEVVADPRHRAARF